MHPKKIIACVDIIKDSGNRPEDPEGFTESETINALERYRKLLVLEIGSEEMVDAALNNPSGWRGRAEKIAELEGKVQRLANSKRDVPTLIVDKRRTAELEITVQQLKDSIKHSEAERLSLKSRIKSLEGSLKIAREDIQLLIQRERQNSQIPEILRQFILNN